MTDIFSWQNLNYVVPVKDGERKLLDNVSGYVVPGKLTALMYGYPPSYSDMLIFRPQGRIWCGKDDAAQCACGTDHDRRSVWGYLCQRTSSPARLPIADRLRSGQFPASETHSLPN
jgi:hypothetical protein